MLYISNTSQPGYFHSALQTTKREKKERVFFFSSPVYIFGGHLLCQCALEQGTNTTFFKKAHCFVALFVGGVSHSEEGELTFESHSEHKQNLLLTLLCFPCYILGVRLNTQLFSPVWLIPPLVLWTFSEYSASESYLDFEVHPTTNLHRHVHQEGRHAVG